MAGFPNGRRVFDDVVTIELRALAGATLPLVDKSFKPDGCGGSRDRRARRKRRGVPQSVPLSRRADERLRQSTWREGGQGTAAPARAITEPGAQPARSQPWSQPACFTPLSQLVSRSEPAAAQPLFQQARPQLRPRRPRDRFGPADPTSARLATGCPTWEDWVCPGVSHPK